MVTNRRVGRLSQLARFATAILRNRIRYRNPIMLMHSVTEACNARCPYCVFRHGKGGPDELTLEEIADLYRQASALSMRYVHLWGGEPLVHPRLSQILAAAKDAGMITGLVTNGMLLARRAEEIVTDLDRLYVSVDYPGSQHDVMRDTPGLYEAILAGVERVRSLAPHQSIVFSCTLFRENIDAMEEMVELCRRLRVRLYVIPMRLESNMGTKNPGTQGRNAEVFEVDNTERVVSWPDQRAAWAQLIELKKKGYPVINTYHYMRTIARHGAPPTYRCHWPKICVGIESNGDIVDCQDWTRPVSSIRERPLAEIVQLPRMRALYGRDGESCNACTTPARVEPSRVWGLYPGALWQGAWDMVLRRPVPRPAPVLLPSAAK